MGFNNGMIDKIWRLLANSWYSVLINGQAHGFFYAIRGVKQGDPLFPALFILSAEVLSRALNALFLNSNFKCFGMPKWSENMNHLAYADDTIIFASADKTSLQSIMMIIGDYELQSGQKVNREKSFFYVLHKTAGNIVQEIEDITGFTKGNFPYAYFGCPSGQTRKREGHFTQLIKKVHKNCIFGKGSYCLLVENMYLLIVFCRVSLYLC